MLKKTAVAVLAFGSSAVFSGTMGFVCVPGSVNVPCVATAWDFGLQALYLQPNYGAELSNVGFSRSTNELDERAIEIEPKWSWGFQLEGSYHFSTGNDLNLNWYHISAKTIRAVGTNVFGQDTAFFPTPSDVDTAAYSIKPRWDAGNLEFGQHVDFGDFKNIRFHGGVQYARIKSTLRNSSFLASVAFSPEEDGPTGTLTFTSRAELKYSGFGPRTGADMSYDLGNGLALYGNAAAAILLGESKTNASQVQVGTLDDGTTVDSSTLTRNSSRTALVPEIEGKLGLIYTYAMAQGNLTLNVGYMWVNYFNAQQVVLSDTDFGVHGGFAGLKWVGNVT